MPYGQGQALGATIDPRMFVQDYSGFAKAAAIQAAGMMNFGNQIGGAIKDYTEENKKIKSEIAKGETALKYAKANYPQLAAQIDELQMTFKDPTKSNIEKAAIGSQMNDYVALMIGGERYKQEMSLKEREAKIREAAMMGELTAPQPSPLGDPIAVPDGKGGTVMMQRNKMTGALVPAQFDGDPILQDLPPLDGNGNPIEQAADMWGANGMVFPNKGAIAKGIEGAARLGYKPPEGGAGTVMTGDELAETIKKGLEVNAEPIGNNQYRVKEVKGSPTVQQSKGVVMSKEEVKKLKADGFKIEGEPVDGGGFRVTKFDTAKANIDNVLELVGKAHALAKEGKKDEAIMIFQALGFNAFGMPANMDTLESLVPEPSTSPPLETPIPPTPPTVPLSERLKQIQ